MQVDQVAVINRGEFIAVGYRSCRSLIGRKVTKLASIIAPPERVRRFFDNFCIETNMNCSKNWFFVLFLASQPSFSQQTDFNELVNQYQRESNVLKIDAAVWSKDGICSTASSAANSVTGIPRYHGASVSKLFTAVVIMQLRDEGKLKLNEPLNTYLPEFKNSDVKILHLLTHTSGIRDRRADKRLSFDEVDKYFWELASRRSNKPGERWRYADANFNILGRVIEVVSGNAYSDVMWERLLGPLEMSDSSFEIAQIPKSDRVVAYNKRERAEEHPWHSSFLASAGLQTTAIDLTKFGKAVLDVVSDATSNLLAKDSLLEMVEPRLETDYRGVGQALAWQIGRTEIGVQWRHAGGEDGFEGLITIYPDVGATIAVLANQEDWLRFELERDLRNAVHANQLNCS